MPYVERSDGEIVAILEIWVATHPDPDKPFVFEGGKTYTPRGYVEEVKSGSAFGRKVLKFLRDSATLTNTDPLEPLTRAIEANKRVSQSNK